VVGNYVADKSANWRFFDNGSATPFAALAIQKDWNSRQGRALPASGLLAPGLAWSLVNSLVRKGGVEH